MDAFFGSWKLVKTEHFGKYLQALGVDDERIGIAKIIKPTLTFYQDGDYVVLKTETSIHTGEVWFKLGEEFFEKSRDGRDCQNIITLDGKKLVQVQKWDGNECTFVREVHGHQMVMTLTYGSVVATATYEKV